MQQRLGTFEQSERQRLGIGEIGGIEDLTGARAEMNPFEHRLRLRLHTGENHFRTGDEGLRDELL